MARLARYFVEGQPQHLIQRGNNREPIFVANDDYRFYLECLQEAAERYGSAIHAYVLMTNHTHPLATPEMQSSLPKTMQSVGRRYVQYFNFTYYRTGTLWEGRYKATVIDSEAYRRCRRESFALARPLPVGHALGTHLGVCATRLSVLHHRLRMGLINVQPPFGLRIHHTH